MNWGIRSKCEADLSRCGHSGDRRRAEHGDSACGYCFGARVVAAAAGWHYVVATYNSSSGTMTFYVDGQLIGTGTTSSAQSYSGYWRVGGNNLNGGWNLNYWNSNSQGTTQPHSY
jgi:Concanavalin A-like lectin/glucanases superfamily